MITALCQRAARACGPEATLRRSPTSLPANSERPHLKLDGRSASSMGQTAPFLGFASVSNAWHRFSFPRESLCLESVGLGVFLVTRSRNSTLQRLDSRIWHCAAPSPTVSGQRRLPGAGTSIIIRPSSATRLFVGRSHQRPSNGQPQPSCRRYPRLSRCRRRTTAPTWRI